MSDFEKNSVLPSHSTAFEQALEKASIWLIDSSPIVNVWNPDTCPPEFLPWLAWSVSVNDWQPSWQTEQKRAAIRDSVVSHRLTGTVHAVRSSLQNLGFSTQITEWFEPEAQALNAEPFTFYVDAFAEDILSAGLEINPALLELLSRSVEEAKPARAHFALRVGEVHKLGLSVETASRLRLVDRLRTRPNVPATNHRQSIAARASFSSTCVSRLIHQPLLPTEVY